ncbi:LPXTG cell wall anchor domain-containing protein [Solicola gregarius]|uniref:LPXTG cell wall anchor domain-containing protein n=1 Tax=Solicola gregarius TaxID=2908642 RepID=A0AA46TH44_9ACTN|nr:LPXTG cell wall anchor domain-containing protein [Solicola gregarius]UYM04712.1 LPXTG cell wall anchor domain-containing protein [Solicola gregarius]
MFVVALIGLVLVVAAGWYVSRRRADVMDYHDLDEVRINRHREGGV